MEKPILEVYQRSFLEVDYDTLEEFIQEVYKDEKWSKGWSFVATEECGNDSEHSFTVQKKKFEPSEYAKDLGRQRTASILNDLAAKDLIEEGNYLITVCW